MRQKVGGGLSFFGGKEITSFRRLLRQNRRRRNRRGNLLRNRSPRGAEIRAAVMAEVAWLMEWEKLEVLI